MKRTDVIATVAIVAGLGLGIGAISWTGSADSPPTPSRSDTGGSVAARPGDVPSTAPVTTLSPQVRAPEKEKAERARRPSRGESYGKGAFAPGRPTAIRIRRLGVDAAVFPIAAVDGSLVPPSDYTTVGWWADGPAPGSAEGTAIITGHTVHAGGGAFDDLGALRRGDRVIVERPRRDLEYVVRSVTNYRKGALAHAAGRVFATDGRARLALVTCSDFNGEIYLSNVVVVATHPLPLRR